MIRREKESFDDQIEVKLEVEKRRIIFFMKISSNTLAQFALHVNDFKNICVKCLLCDCDKCRNLDPPTNKMKNLFD
jgi:hypothetical protein